METASTVSSPHSSHSDEKEKMNWQRHFPPLLQSFYFQLVAGLNDANLGIILPSIKAQYGLNEYVVSIVFLCTTAGYMLAAILNGHIIQRFSQVTCAMIGSVSLVSGYLIFSCPIPFPVFCVFMATIGFGLALIQSMANVVCSKLPHSTVILNFLHAFYGLGALVAPLIASSVHDWQDTYRLFCGLAGLNIILQLFTFHNYEKKKQTTEQDDHELASRSATTIHVDEEGGDISSVTTVKRQRLIYNTLRQPILPTGAAFLILYVGTEVCLGNWGYTFLISTRSNDTVMMARAMTGYWAGIAAGRLFLGWLTLKCGEKRMIYGYLSILIGMLFLLWFVPLVSVNTAALVIIGIALGPLFPTTVALTSKVVPEELHASTIGFLCAFGNSGSAIFPFLGGVLMGSVGVKVLLPFCVSLSILMLISWLFVPNPEPATITWHHWVRDRVAKKASPSSSASSTSTEVIGADDLILSVRA